MATVSAFKGVGSKVRDRQPAAGLGIPLIPGLASVLVEMDVGSLDAVCLWESCLLTSECTSFVQILLVLQAFQRERVWASCLTLQLYRVKMEAQAGLMLTLQATLESS